MRERYRAIARVAKTHGKKGEVVTVPVHGLPLVLDVGMDVYPVPPALKGPRGYRVSSCVDSETGQLVALRGVWSIDAASQLVGKTLLVPESQLPEGFALHDVERLVGLEVCDASRGLLGTIEEVMQGVANDVWVVRGPLGEVLVPVVPEMVLSVDEGAAIQVDLPVGLVEGE